MTQPEIVAVAPVEHKSKWGYHVCEYSVYQRLKALNKVYWECQRLEKARRRYFRKLPRNRVHRTYRRNEKGQRIGVESVRPASPPRTPIIDPAQIAWVPWLYREARTPFASSALASNVAHMWGFHNDTLDRITLFYNDLTSED